MTTKKVVWIHAFSFLLLFVVFFFSSEKLINVIMPDEHNVVFWLWLIVFGFLCLLVITILSLVSILVYRKIKKSRNQK